MTVGELREMLKDFEDHVEFGLIEPNFGDLEDISIHDFRFNVPGQTIGIRYPCCEAVD